MRCNHRLHSGLILAVLAFVLTGPFVVDVRAVAVSDSLYNAHHPRLLFSPGDLPGLLNKVTDGGPDDAAWQFIEQQAQTTYPQYPGSGILGAGFGLETFPNLGLVGHITSPTDEASLLIGRELTVQLADGYAVDFDEANSGLRLRSLALGYDMFFATAHDSVRAPIRAEIESYLTLMTTSLAYELYEYRPYLANHSAMFAAAMGLAAICLQDEGDPVLLAAALAMADRICHNLIIYQIDERGSYGEGGFYALWTMKHLVYYFSARRRFDGYDYASYRRVRAVEEWLAYELLPVGSARTLNTNDSAYYSRPFSLQSAYFAWATDRWSSGLSAWMWDRVAGTYGVSFGDSADKAGTVLWLQPVPQAHPSSLLPLRQLFSGRGLYHYRTGWQTGARSDDILFAFFSGEFQGGHLQEDQNQFVLHGYGALLVVDHGPGGTPKESEAHNMVFIDGAGQHNAGFSIGTDGAITEYLLGGFADYVMGDATAAYTTHSRFNDPDWPVDGVDWSWGYSGANPVEYALRRVLAVDDGTVLPYFIVMDDIRKDGSPHSYQWRMHTSDSNSVNIATHPYMVTADSALMEIHLLSPDPGAVSVATVPYDNTTQEANSIVVCISQTAVDADFSVLLLPAKNGMALPVVSTAILPWGIATTIDFGGGVADILLRNDSGGMIVHDGIESDAGLTLVRRQGGSAIAYLATNGASLTIDGTLFAEMLDGPASFALSGQSLFIDRYDADYRFVDNGATDLHYRDQELGLVSDGTGYLVSDQVTAVTNPVPGATPLSLSAHPNPFNPTTTILVTAPEGNVVAVTVYDVAGRLVRTLWQGVVTGGVRVVAWDGTNNAGATVASGTYYVLATTGTSRFVSKVTMLK